VRKGLKNRNNLNIMKCEGLLWTQVAEEKMYQACMAQFRQNPQLHEYLKSTRTKEIVGANGRENFFGVYNFGRSSGF